MLVLMPRAASLWSCVLFCGADQATAIFSRSPAAKSFLGIMEEPRGRCDRIADRVQNSNLHPWRRGAHSTPNVLMSSLRAAHHLPLDVECRQRHSYSRTQPT